MKEREGGEEEEKGVALASKESIAGGEDMNSVDRTQAAPGSTQLKRSK